MFLLLTKVENVAEFNIHATFVEQVNTVFVSCRVQNSYLVIYDP
jgi:hypothetical protein